MVLRNAFLISLIDFLFGMVELLLFLRIILRLFGANPETPFVNWIYETSGPLIAPFKGIFPNPVLQGGFVLEFSTVFGLLIYALVAYLISELIDFISYHSRHRIEYGQSTTKHSRSH